MLWIIPLCLLFVFLCVYSYFIYTRKINNKLNKKQRYLENKPRIEKNFSTNCRISFMLCALMFLSFVAFLFIPHTNGTVKDLNSRSDYEYLFNNYYNKTPEKEQDLVDTKHIANSIRPANKKQNNISLNKDKFIYYEDSKLYLKMFSGDVVSYQYDDNLTDVQIKIFKEYVFVYTTNQDTSYIYIHNFSNLDLVEKLVVQGQIQVLSNGTNDIIVGITHQYNENTPLIKKESSSEEFYLDIEDIHYVPEKEFNYNFTIVTLNVSDVVDMFSLCVEEHYIFDTPQGIFIVENSVNHKKEYITNVFLYDISLGFIARKIDILGYTYINPELTKDYLNIQTVEKTTDIKIFHDYQISLGLLRKTSESITTTSKGSKIALNLDNDAVFAEIKENMMTFSKEVDEKEYTYQIDINTNKVTTINDSIYLISDNDSKVIEKLYFDNGFIIEEVFSYEKLQGFHLVDSYYDDCDKFIFASLTKVAIVSLKDNSFEIIKVYKSEAPIIKLDIIDDEIIIIVEDEVIVYPLKSDKTLFDSNLLEE